MPLISVAEMSLVFLAVMLIVLGVLILLVNPYIPVDGKVQKNLNIVVVICVFVWLLYAFGILDHSSDIRVSQLKWQATVKPINRMIPDSAPFHAAVQEKKKVRGRLESKAIRGGLDRVGAPLAYGQGGALPDGLNHHRSQDSSSNPGSHALGLVAQPMVALPEFGEAFDPSPFALEPSPMAVLPGPAVFWLTPPLMNPAVIRV